MKPETKHAIRERTIYACKRFGDFASTHEALGVALEEWNEFQDAIHRNNHAAAKSEALDLAAVLIRFTEQPEFPRG